MAPPPSPAGKVWPLPTLGASPQTETQVFVFELGEALRAVRRRMVWPLVGALVLAAAAGLLAMRLGPTYRSSVQVVIDPRGVQVSTQDLVPRSSFFDVLNSVVDTEIRLISSDDVLGSAARIIAAESGSPAMSPEVLRRQLKIQREAASYIVTIEATARTPEGAVQRADAVVKSFLAATRERRQDLARRTLHGLSESLVVQRERLKEAENAVDAYRKRSNIVDRDGVTINNELLSDLNRQLLEARGQIRALAARISRVDEIRRRPGRMPEGDIQDSLILNQLRTTQGEARRELGDLETTLGTKHPRVASAQAQARELSAAIAREAERVATNLRSDYQTAVNREAALAKDLEAMQSRATQSNSALVGLRDLERDAQAQRTVFESYLQRERDLRQQVSFDTETITILSAPRLPTAPAGLNPALVIAAAGMFGALLGALAAILLDRLDGRIHSAARLATATGIPVLGLLPLGRAPSGTVVHALAPKGGSRSSRVLYILRDGLEMLFGRDLGITLVVSLTRRGTRDIVPLSLALAQAEDGRSTILLTGPGAGPLGDLLGSGRVRSPLALAVDGEGRGGIEAMSLAHIAPPGRQGPGEMSLERVLASRGRVVTGLGQETDDETIREFGRLATTILVVVEENVSTFAALEDLRLTLGAHADKAIGAIVVTRGRDGLRAAVEQAASAPRLAVA